MSEVVLIEAILAAAEGEDDTVVRDKLRDTSVVVALALGAVAATNNEEVLDGALLDSVDHLGCYAHHSVASEANGGEFLRRRAI